MQIAFGALDDRLDAVAATSRDTLVARVVICGVFAILIAVNLSPLVSALWLGVYLSTEVWSWFACIRAMRGGELSKVERLNYLGSLLLSGAAWTLLAWFYWQEGTEPSRLIAFSILAGILVHAQCFCFRSPLALIAVAAPSAMMLLILPLGMGAYSGGPLLNLGVVLVLLLTYVIMSARANMQTAQALEAAEHTAVAANDAKSTFLAMVTHELRTPMNGVLGMTRALQRTQLDLRQQGYVETILRSGDGMLTILNDLLDVSKIEAGQMKLDLGNFDLRAVAEQSVELWSEGAAAKRLSLSCDIDSALPDYVRGDETRIRQIINNLLSNALKFTDTGSVRLSLSAAPGPEAIAGVEITVTDTGPGMTPEQVEDVFRAYGQAEASTARRYGGTGLGLSICRNLAAAMDGSITCESQRDHGSVFRVWLPLPSGEAPELKTKHREDAASLPPLRLLVADDNATNLAVARVILEAAGAHVETVSNGADALDRLRHERFDAVLMDVHMPVMDGIEAVGRIRDGQAGPADIPIIALTADGGAGEEARLRSLGFDALQLKPVQPALLLAAVLDATCARQSAKSVDLAKRI